MRSALSALVVGLVVLSAVAAMPVGASPATADSDATANSSPATGSDAEPDGEADPDGAVDASAATTAASSHDRCEPVATGDQPDDPETDRLGWENGCWYNESIAVTRGDGLNDTELDAVVGRAMARVEVVRELEFERTIPVEIVSRETFRQTNATGGDDGTVANRLHQNVKWEAMFMVNETTDAIAVQEANRGSVIGGFYSPSQERIVIVSENATSPKMNEITLSQELFHALQDQRFDISSYDRRTEEENNAVLGIIEGDGNLVDRLYEQRCNEEWDCLLPEQSSGGGDTSSIHWGMYFLSYQPYSDGPKFVQQIYDEAGWDGVNAVYENPPESTEQVIHTEKYLEDSPTDVTVEDRSSDEWRVPDLGEGHIDYAEFGEAGLATMLYYPSYASGGMQQPVVGAQEFFNLTASGDPSSFDPFNYSFEYSTGWDGDKLYPYVTDDSAETGETGYVWKTVWDSEDDAGEFVDAYRQLLTYHGAQTVDGRERTFQIADGEEFGDAFYVDASGTTVTVVNAPSVEELSEVREGAAPETDTDTETATQTPTPVTETETGTTTATEAGTDADTETAASNSTATETTAETTDGGAQTETTGSDGPGFGPVAAVIALVLAALAALAGRKR